MTRMVLAIDDSRTMRELIAASLVPAGYDVHVAQDGEDGVAALETITPDIILTDINMPRLDGFGVIAAVRRSDAHRATPVLVITTESAPELKARARAAGATGWIVKPFEADALVAAVRRVMG
ncbi:two-component system chemotaxis response regulator CheY [Amaricoccus macauensis]|uniref:Two-component system chemotaxis response regulator CheY n=1 Tax=Amaricoccus macauensis TaxID=57001 RepID=A0A840SLI8_9RHOB|nr:response regulator [Amaricoccus macauensis]MBB5220231.1 two-component system chemotaxis response regulator CheY [Amaricoccus macauensis]